MSRARSVALPCFLCVLCLAVVAAALGCRGAGAEKAEGPRRGGRALNVKVAKVASRDVAYAVRALGSLEADEMVQVTAEVSGAVAEVRFQAGDRVTPATVLARIDPERFRLEAERAQATYRRAAADQQRAQADFKRRETLAAERLVSTEELERTRLEAERLAADAAAAKAALDIALQNQRRSDVRPARAGQVNARQVDTGQFVQVGTTLATLVDTSRLRLRFKLSEKESLRIAEGQTVTFRVAALGDSRFNADVYHVADVADPATRQVEALAWVKNPGPLKPGFFAEVELATDVHANAIVVPEGAVQASESGFVAYVVDGGKARQRVLRIGLRTGDGLVEVLSGLASGETVVALGSDRLADGIEVAAQ